MSESLPRFAELHVVSDLHLGGEPRDPARTDDDAPVGQVFDLGKAFAAYVAQLPAGTADAPVALVINGDFVDFLAEQPAKAFDSDGAPKKLERIREDRAFTPVFDALAAFLAGSGHHLVFVLGNHDLELALPEVREYLTEQLTEQDPAGRRRLHFAFTGGGFRCKVGERTVLCAHGNEVDDFNVTNYHLLAHQVAGWRRPPWRANGGSRLVVEVMNALKRKYPFVDLLKPEASAAVPVLLALDPRALRHAPDLWGPLQQRRLDAHLREVGLLGDRGGLSTPGAYGAPDWTLPESDEELLARVEERVARGGEDPFLRIGRDEAERRARGEGIDLLGWWSDLGDKVGGVVRSVRREAVRWALDRFVDHDAVTDPAAADDLFRDLDAATDAGVDFLLAGHTHQRRFLRRSSGRGVYYNTGTWIPLMTMEESFLDDPRAFERFFATLAEGDLAALDRAHLLVRRPTVVTIRANDGTVEAAMHEVVTRGKKRGSLSLVPKTEVRR